MYRILILCNNKPLIYSYVPFLLLSSSLLCTTLIDTNGSGIRGIYYERQRVEFKESKDKQIPYSFSILW